MSKPHEEVYIETYRVGGGLEVRAVDASDGLEVSFIAPVTATQQQIEQLALAKLAYVRRKASGGGDDGESEGGGGGVLA